jgi:3-oxoadipate enol-lactonase
VKIGIGSEGVFAVTRGAGRPVVLLHSLLADRGSFDRIIDPLCRAFRVIALDLPGFGESAAVTGGLADFADRVARAIHGLTPGEQPIVLGNGFGGFIALQMAIRHPDLASRLVLANCGAAFSETGRQAFHAMAAAAKANGLAAIVDTAMRRLFTADFQAQNPALMAERRAAFLCSDAATFQTACHSLASLDLRRDIHRISIPVLVLVGENDEATPPPMSVELASLLTDARLCILPGCAHVPQLQMPEVFLAAVEEFIG